MDLLSFVSLDYAAKNLRVLTRRGADSKIDGNIARFATDKVFRVCLSVRAVTAANGGGRIATPDS